MSVAMMRWPRPRNASPAIGSHVVLRDEREAAVVGVLRAGVSRRDERQRLAAVLEFRCAGIQTEIAQILRRLHRDFASARETAPSSSVR